MNSTERRSIERIIKGRFELLSTELDELAGEYRARALEGVTEQYAKELKAASDAQAQLLALASKLNSQAMELVNKLKAKGIEPTNRYGASIQVVSVQEHVEWQPTGIEQAKRLATDEINKKVRLAKNNLRREELSILENLHRTTIESGDASEFLADLPTAEDLMLKAAEAKAIAKG